MRPRHQEAHGISHPVGVTGDLLTNKLVVGFVFIEGANDVVAIHPGILAVEI